MKTHAMRNVLVLIVCFVLMLSASESFGQGMYIPTTTRINTPHGPVNLTSYHYMPMHMPWMYSGASGPVSDVYEFNVVMKDDSVFTTTTSIQREDSIDYLEVRRGKEKIRINVSDTKMIWRYKLNTRRQIIGVASDSCWLFPIVRGAINCFSSLAEPDRISYTTAIQYGDNGEIVPLTKENLLEITGYDDKAIMRQVKKMNLPGAVKIFNKKMKAADEEIRSEKEIPGK